MKQYSFYSKKDPNKEALGKTFALTRLSAAKKFASNKNLSLKDFLKIFTIDKN